MRSGNNALLKAIEVSSFLVYHLIWFVLCYGVHEMHVQRSYHFPLRHCLLSTDMLNHRSFTEGNLFFFIYLLLFFEILAKRRWLMHKKPCVSIMILKEGSNFHVFICLFVCLPTCFLFLFQWAAQFYITRKQI